MIHDNFYAKYTIIKNTDPLNNPNIIRVSFYHNKTKVGQAYISDFDKSTGFLFNFKIYKKYQHRHYGTDAFEYLTTHFQLRTLLVRSNNKHAIHIYSKFGFIFVDEIYNNEDHCTYSEMLNLNNREDS